MQSKRYLLIDGIRGFAVANMVLFHLLYDVFMVYGINPHWYFLPHIHIWQQAICRTFIFVAGFVWRLGEENNLRRGIFFNACGLTISLITSTVLPSEAVWFGILNFMGCAVLLTLPLHQHMQKIPPAAGMSAALAAFLFFRHVQRGYLGVATIPLLPLPEWLYRVKVLTPFGFPYPGFSSSDYFPLLPWYFLFLAGYFCFLAFEKREAWQRAACKNVPFFSLIGQKAIWIYLAHQPLCMLVCAALFDWNSGSA